MLYLQRISAYLKFLFSSQSRFENAPFVSNFYHRIIDGDMIYYRFGQLESIDQYISTLTQTLPIVDYGAGSKYGDNNEKSVKKIRKQQVSSSYQLRIIWRIIHEYQCKSIIELGTSIGLSTIYLASVFKDSQVDALEGNPHFVKFAKELANKNGFNNINFYVGEFDSTLEEVIENKKYDLVFLDGNHNKTATLKYYNTLLPHLHSKSIVIVDDIYWSKDMEDLWAELKAKKEVTLSIDLYFMGILFFDKKIINKNNFTIRTKIFN